MSEALEFSLEHYRRIGYDAAPLIELATQLPLASEEKLPSLLSEFRKMADQAPVPIDYDFGAVLLEAVGDECPIALRKPQLYKEALARAALFASYATSGGEGIARMQDVHRIRGKTANSQ